MLFLFVNDIFSAQKSEKILKLLSVYIEASQKHKKNHTAIFEAKAILEKRNVEFNKKENKRKGKKACPDTDNEINEKIKNGNINNYFSSTDLIFHEQIHHLF